MAQTEIYTAKMGQPPMPDEGPTSPMPRKRKRAMNPNMPPGQTDIYTADKGQPPMDDEGPTVNIKPKKYATGGSVGGASKRADGCAQRGKTKGRMV